MNNELSIIEAAYIRESIFNYLEHIVDNSLQRHTILDINIYPFRYMSTESKDDYISILLTDIGRPSLSRLGEIKYKIKTG